MKKKHLQKNWTELCFLIYRLNTHTCMYQNARLCKYPHKHSNLGLKWKQTAEKESYMCNTGPGQLLKWQQYNIHAVCHSCLSNNKTENLSLLLTKSLLEF